MGCPGVTLVQESPWKPRSRVHDVKAPSSSHKCPGCPLTCGWIQASYLAFECLNSHICNIKIMPTFISASGNRIKLYMDIDVPIVTVT